MSTATRYLAENKNGRQVPKQTVAGAAPRVVVAHSGKQHAYRHAHAVFQAGHLARFVTSSYYKRASFPDRLVATLSGLDRRLRRRHFEGLPSSLIERRWGLEIPELVARGLAGNGALASRLVMRRDARFDRWVARHFANAGDVYWGFQGSCLESLKAAKTAGSVAVAEFATAHVTRAIEVLSQEAERHPEWADSISNFSFPDWYRERLEQEPHAADVCIAASGFTRDSLLEAGVKAERIRMLPLGADVSQFTPVERRERGTFRILFVGGVGQRKGIKYLLEAYRRIRSTQTELVVAGPVVGSGKALAEYRGMITLVGRLDQAEVVRLMQECHVLVLPSVFEGFGLVIPEAMATGMPVIASTHSIGPEIIRSGLDGYVLPPDDIDGLAVSLERLAGDRELCGEMGRSGARRAQEFSWERHAARVATVIRDVWNKDRC